VFTARYALSPYIKQTRFVIKGLTSRRQTIMLAVISLHTRNTSFLQNTKWLSPNCCLSFAKTGLPVRRSVCKKSTKDKCSLISSLCCEHWHPIYGWTVTLDDTLQTALRSRTITHQDISWQTTNCALATSCIRKGFIKLPTPTFVSFRSPSLFYLLVHSRCRVFFFFIFTWSHSDTHHSR
jgi:hypothetical protein